MKTIDFLPTRYHEQKAKRKTKVWRLLLLVVFGGICAATAFGQYRLRQSVVQQLNDVESTHKVAVAANNRFDNLQTELQKIRADAELYTFLRHPWPRTQILRAVTKPLPESIALTELQVQSQRERVRRSESQPRNRRRDESTEEQPKMLPARQDLQQMREEFAAARTFVHLTGLTTDTVALHKYVADLSSAKLFSKAELLSLESIDQEHQDRVSEFDVRLIVLPGYGLPNGPAKTAKAKAEKNRAKSGKDDPNVESSDEDTVAQAASGGDRRITQ